MHERMIVVVKLLELRSSVEFDEVLVGDDGRPASRALMVATFLAVLELARLAALRLYQSLSETGVPRGPLHLRRVEASSWGVASLQRSDPGGG